MTGYKIISGNYNLTADLTSKVLEIGDIYLQCNTLLGPVNIQLPPISALGGFLNLKININDIGGNAAVNKITVFADPSAPDLINTQPTLVLTSSGSSSVMSIVGKKDWQASNGEARITDALNLAKFLEDKDTLFLPKVTDDNIFALLGSNTITNWDIASGTGKYVGATDFNKVTGVWTVPETAFFLVNAQIGWRLNDASFAKVSNNPHTVGLPWMTGATDVGSFTMGIFQNITGNLLGVSTKVLTQKIGSLYLNTFSTLYEFVAGSQITLRANNYSDLDIYGQNNSSMAMRVLRIGLP